MWEICQRNTIQKRLNGYKVAMNAHNEVRRATTLQYFHILPSDILFFCCFFFSSIGWPFHLLVNEKKKQNNARNIGVNSFMRRSDCIYISRVVSLHPLMWFSGVGRAWCRRGVMGSRDNGAWSAGDTLTKLIQIHFPHHLHQNGIRTNDLEPDMMITSSAFCKP